MISSVSVVVHEKEKRPYSQNYMLWTFCSFWREMGIQVHVTAGCDDVPDADVVIPCLGLTRMPGNYAEFFDSCPRVVNGAVRDISKRRISSQLVGPDDGYDGPVIVKTDLNCGGWLEIRLLESFFSRVWEKLRRSAGVMKHARTLASDRYPIFSSLAQVPREVFDNPHLVVEKYRPEMQDGLYCLRTYVFFGDSEVNALKTSPCSIVKARNVTSRKEVPVPGGIRALRRELGFDFGKFDYVMHGEEVVLLDANPTPTHTLKSSDTNLLELSRHLANGLMAWDTERRSSFFEE